MKPTPIRTNIARELADTALSDALRKAAALAELRLAEIHGPHDPLDGTERALLRSIDLCGTTLNEFQRLLAEMPEFREEDRLDYELTPDSVVVDLGCFKGDFTSAIHDKYKCRVFAFEPVAHFFADCLSRFKPKNSNVRVLNYAVGGENGVVNGFERADSSGVFATDGIGKWSAGMITMDVALGLIGVAGADLLKINIEGSEFPLLEDMVRKDLVRNFSNILVQFHDVVPDAANRYEVLQNELYKTHHLTLYSGWSWQNWMRNE